MSTLCQAQGEQQLAGQVPLEVHDMLPVVFRERAQVPQLQRLHRDRYSVRHGNVAKLFGEKSRDFEPAWRIFILLV